MHKLPDGSGFFIGTIGPREPGFINFLKYNKVGCARLYLFRWRMFWTAFGLSELLPESGPLTNVWKAFKYAISLP